MDRDDRLRDLLQRVHTIAVVGIKDGRSDDAYRVPAYLQHCGYRILPVNPKLVFVRQADGQTRVLDPAPTLVFDAVDARWIYFSVNMAALAELNQVFSAFFDVDRIQPRRPTCGPQGSVVPMTDIVIG